MTRLRVERLGGFAGFGLPGSALRSVGEIDSEALGAADQAQIEALFRRRATAVPNPDGFVYRITRASPGGSVAITEAPEAQVPQALRDCVRDELA